MITLTKTRQNKSSSLVSARTVAKYLFSLDSDRKYFVNKKIDENNHPTPFIIGNFRLNKVLQIIQLLYYARHNQPFFKGNIKAYENGGIISSVYGKFKHLSQESKKSNFRTADPY